MLRYIHVHVGTMDDDKQSYILVIGFLVNLLATLAGIVRASRCTTVDSRCGCLSLHLERDVLPAATNEQLDNSN